MVDALVSGTSVARRGGSSPLIRTKQKDRPCAGPFVSKAQLLEAMSDML
jgi:hypothetical protein